MDKPDFHGNRDTGFLKTIAFITMMADHVGYLFFPDEMLWRYVGRIAFPLFAYCCALGAYYTKDIKKYIFRIFILGVVTQPFYTLCFFPQDISAFPKGFHLNVCFTLCLGIAAVCGLKKQKYVYTAAALLLSFVPNFEYGIYGAGFIVLIYILAKQEKTFFFTAMGIWLFSPAFGAFFGGYFDPQCLAVFSLIFICIKTNSKIKLARIINYGFYPLHIILLLLLKIIIL